ncbi:HET-domain-containing protein [Cadophora sp. DSE1049]|nr:HET-domain-containing protein [Cadophora sp. DSE1049]
MNECLGDHNDFCPASTMSPLPSRVIDVGSTEVPPKIVISNGSPGRWLALSHCWGTKVRFVLDSSNVRARQQGIPLEDMPSAFSDAIQVSRRLGYQYLWIDSLCIIQDSHGDWAYESSQMLNYYQNSSLTIALDDTPGDEQGFLDIVRASDDDAVQVQVIVPPGNDTIKPTIESEDTPEHVSIRGFSASFASGPCFLATRGWTLQEDILSPRTVHYRSGHLAWECQTHRKYELYEGTKDFAGDPFGPAKQHFLRSPRNLVSRGSWYKILEAYMQRDLTMEGDKFPALAGLARKVGEQTGYTYKAGIWLEQFHGGLLWHCGSPERRVDVFVAPSWSWASMETLVSRPSHVSWCFGPTPACTDNSVGSRAELLDCQVTLAGPDIYGQVQDATITLKSDFLSLSGWPVEWPIVLDAGRWPQTARAWDHEIACHFDEPLPHPNNTGDVFSDDDILRDIYLLQIGNWVSNVSSVNGGTISFFLLLFPVADGKFRRLGTAEALLSQCEAVEGWESLCFRSAEKSISLEFHPKGRLFKNFLFEINFHCQARYLLSSSIMEPDSATIETQSLVNDTLRGQMSPSGALPNLNSTCSLDLRTRLAAEAILKQHKSDEDARKNQMIEDRMTESLDRAERQNGIVGDSALLEADGTAEDQREASMAEDSHGIRFRANASPAISDAETEAMNGSQELDSSSTHQNNGGVSILGTNSSSKGTYLIKVTAADGMDIVEERAMVYVDGAGGASGNYITIGRYIPMPSDHAPFESLFDLEESCPDPCCKTLHGSHEGSSRRSISNPPTSTAGTVPITRANKPTALAANVQNPLKTRSKANARFINLLAPPAVILCSIWISMVLWALYFA